MRVLIAGDFCPHFRVAECIERGDFESVLGEVRPVIEQADYSIVNFECPVCKGPELPIIKCGPNLKCSEKGVEAIKWMGVGCVTLANNHFFDYGECGVDNTISSCENLGIDTVGGGNNLREASKILYKEIGGKCLALINCCEHEFSIATESSGGSNPLNPIKQYYSIKEARKNADYVVVIIHGGHEHYQLPSTRMQDIYRFFIDVGADSVINHHQHCYSGYEFYRGKPIVYGLGNFCFDEGLKEKAWHEGYMVLIEFGKIMNVTLYPCIQCKDEAKVLMHRPEDFDETIKRLNDIITSKEKLQEEEERYYSSVMKSSRNVLNPVVNRYFSYLQYRGLLPDIVSEKWLMMVHNHVMCEAHRDKLLYFLNHRNKQ